MIFGPQFSNIVMGTTNCTWCNGPAPTSNPVCSECRELLERGRMPVRMWESINNLCERTEKLADKK